MTTGTQIFASQFVAIQDKAELLLGNGSGSSGYGQTVQSADVFSGNQITKAQWDALRYDIVNIRMHQDGVMPSIVTVNSGDVIGYGAGSPNTNYNTLLDTAIANKFEIAGNQSIVSSKGSATYTGSWSNSAEFTLTVTFSTADQGRYFFNSGGKIRFTTTLTGGAASPQYNAWTSFLNSTGTRSFGAGTDPFINYYTLTNSFQTYYQGSLTTPYSANTYRLQARTNVSNNSTGTATVLYLKVILTDAYVDNFPASPPPDFVDGTITIAVEELKASGSMIPSGSFAITSPTYSLSSISAS